MSMNPRFHLLGLQAGERFRLVTGRTERVYEVVEVPQPDKEPSLAVRDPDGPVVTMREIAFRNNGSFFVELIPGDRPCS